VDRMVDIEPGKEPRPERARSVTPPVFGLATAIQKARLIHRAEQTAPVPFVIAVKHMGFSGPTGPALRALAALKAFGIMTEEAGQYCFTSEGLAVLTQHEGEREAAAQMAMKPEVFRQILGRYPERLPSDPSLKVTLVRDFRLTEAAADTVIAALHETLDFVRDHDGRAADLPQPIAPPSTVAPVGAPPTATGSRAAGPAPSRNATATSGGTLHVWSLGAGAFVELHANRALTPAQFALLKRYIELAELAETNPSLRPTECADAGH
jgi:hypothetical protein